MARTINKFDITRYIAYISFDTVTNLYTVWFKNGKSPATTTAENLNKSAKEYIKKAHSYTYGVSTYYRLER